MCNRYILQDPQDLSERMRVDDIDFSIFAFYNAAPSQYLPVVVEVAPDDRRLHLMHWGLLPPWKSKKPLPPPTNARAETVNEKPMFRKLLAGKRCLVPASGFYEWQDRGKGERKQPYFIRVRDERIIAFAGLWDDTKPEAAPDAVAGSFTIITTAANDAILPVHHRMPVILDRSEEDIWLESDIETGEAMLPLLDAFPAERLDLFPVSTRVNNARNDDESLIEPLETERDPEQGTLF